MGSAAVATREMAVDFQDRMSVREHAQLKAMSCLRYFAYGWFLFMPLLSVSVRTLPACGAERSHVIIEKVEPTPLFPRVRTGQALRQRAMLHLDNPGAPLAATARIAVGDSPAYTEELGEVATGQSVKPIPITDISTPTKVTITVRPKGSDQPLAKHQMTWQPQKKWKIYCVSYSHQDLGYGGYPHRLRTDNRHANFDQALQHCSDTDDWHEDSKYRYVVEGSEALTSYLGTCSQAKALELARRVRQGRIQISAQQAVLGAEQLSHECLARLFYLGRRHAVDLLEAPAGRTAILTDTVGPAWPLAAFCAEAGVPYFFHGHNACGCCRELESEPVSYWQGPGRTGRDRVLLRSVEYAADRICGLAWSDGILEVKKPDGTAIANIVTNMIRKYAERHWPYDALLSQDAFDFSTATREEAEIVHRWSDKFAYPRLISATLDMFFDDIAKQIDPTRIKTYAKDGNNQWADEDPPFAWALALARRTGETLPTAEKFETIAAALTPGGYRWTDIYQAYHSLLRYQEEANGAADWAVPGEDGAQYYETELQEYQEMIEDAAFFTRRVMDNALGRLAAAVTTEADKTLVVFNPLCRTRTDVVHLRDAGLKGDSILRDDATGTRVQCQSMPDGSLAFVASDVPSLGYRTFSLLSDNTSRTAPTVSPSNGGQLENRFYRIRFDAATGTITSIWDKQLNGELVDQAAREKFNEYLYEHFESPNRTIGPQWHRVKSARLSAAEGPVASAMTVAASAAGASRIEQQVILYHDVKRIDFVMALDKSPSGRSLADYNANNAMGKESVYVALPLAVPGCQIRHELPGGMAEPIRDQFEGTCTAFYAIRHFTDLSNDQFGVTVAPVESALVEYGYPRSCALFRPEPGIDKFEQNMTYPAHSRLYLYLMNNMFSTNIRIDQRGPMTFSWSLRSHAGDWKAGRADQFGWDIHNPLIARPVSGRRKGDLPAGSHSFVTVDPPNVVCTTIKPAENNGAGLILRFVETTGTETAAKVSIALPGQIAAATETNLVEDDRKRPLEVGNGKQVAFAIRPFGVTTIRVLYKAPTALPAVRHVTAKPVSDREVTLTWQADAEASKQIRQYRVYRGTKPDFRPGLLSLVQRPATASCTDRPQLHYGGWINNRLEPDTTYYYRVAAVDGLNNEGPICAPVPVTTLKSSEKDGPPLEVEGFRAFVVSDVASYNYVNLLWRSNCESDIVKYEIYRDTAAGFVPAEAKRIAVVDVTRIDSARVDPRRYGPNNRPLREYDHQMYADKDVRPQTTYYYRACAVDAAGQRGSFAREAVVTTKKQ
jgi:hypothetical protein